MLDKFVIQGINNATDFLLKEVQKRTPEDTFRLQRGNKKQKVTNNSGIIHGGLINEVPYAPYVEYGVGRPFNYYKDGGRRKGAKPFFTGVGARMYTKSQFENDKVVRDIIQDSIAQGIRSLNAKK